MSFQQPHREVQIFATTGAANAFMLTLEQWQNPVATFQYAGAGGDTTRVFNTQIMVSYLV